MENKNAMGRLIADFLNKLTANAAEKDRLSDKNDDACEQTLPRLNSTETGQEQSTYNQTESPHDQNYALNKKTTKNYTATEQFIKRHEQLAKKIKK